MRLMRFTETKPNYETPTVETISLQVERGFAYSSNNTWMNDGEDDGWGDILGE